MKVISTNQKLYLHTAPSSTTHHIATHLGKEPVLNSLRLNSTELMEASMASWSKPSSAIFFSVSNTRASTLGTFSFETPCEPTPRVKPKRFYRPKVTRVKSETVHEPKDDTKNETVNKTKTEQ